MTESLGNQSSYTTSVVGGKWYVTDAQGSGCSSCTQRGNVHNVYDSFGNITSRTNELGHTSSYIYDTANNLTSESVPLDGNTTATTSYTYNSLGEPLTVTDPLGHTTTSTYECPSCAGADGPKIANAVENATFVYKPKLKDCGTTGPLTFMRLRHTLALGPSAFTPVCCSLASTVVHEAVHSLTHLDDKAYGIEEKYFGCTDPRKP